MTRDEFIDGYMKRSEIPASWRIEDGYSVSGRPYRALPCACGEKQCEGWAMVSDELRPSHEQLYAPI